MSKLSSAPNYCSCTVNQARNLPEKGKNGGIDAFCTISMGKEKFVTAVCEKTTKPEWHEQCDMPIVDDAKIKLTVYHNSKSSLSKGDFVGRAYVSLRDLQDYDRVHTNWHQLTNKDGKLDKNRGEIEVTLQFYSKNNFTGSVLDLATKKKHLSLKDIKHSLSDKLKSATKHRKNTGDNQLGDQHHRFGGDDASMNNVRDFLGDSASETTSFAGSHMSLNSMSYNNNAEQQKKKTRTTSSGLGSTPYSSHRSVTSDYETSSILDSASMYGGDEIATASPSVRSQIQQQHHEVYVGDDLPPKPTSNKKKTKEPSTTAPTIITTKLSNSSPSPVSTDHSRHFSVPDTVSRPHELTSTPDSLFGLSTIKENIRSPTSPTHQTDDEIDNYFNQIKQPNEPKKTKSSAPIIPQSKTTVQSKEQKRSTLSQFDDIQTPSTSISVKPDTTPTSSSTTVPAKKQSDDTHDSTDEDVDELLGKLERMSSMRSSVKRKIQPRDDIMQQSLTEPDNKFSSGYHQTPPNRNNNTTLPDIVGQPSPKNSSQYSASPGPKKPANTGLCVLGYENVKSTPVNPKVRQELDYLDREELLHVIAYQTDIIKKRDTRVKDLEQYTDGLLVKIVEQCPTILQNGGITFDSKY